MTTRCRLHGKYPVSDRIRATSMHSFTLTAHTYFPPQTRVFPLWVCVQVCVTVLPQGKSLLFTLKEHSLAYLHQENLFINSSICCVFPSLFGSDFSLSVPSMSVSFPLFYYPSLFHSSLNIFFLLQRSDHLPALWQQPKKTCERARETVWGKVRHGTVFPSKLQISPLNPLTPIPLPTHTNPRRTNPGIYQPK